MRRYIWWTRVWRVGGVVTAIAVLTAITIIRNESVDLGSSLSLPGTASLIPAIYLLVSNPARSWAEPKADPTGARPQDRFVIALVVVAVAVAITCWLSCRAIVRSPVPADTSHRQAVRHAIRSVAIMSVLGGSSMATGLVGSKLSQSVSALSSDVAPLRWLLSSVTLLSGLAVVGGMLLTSSTVPRFAPFPGRLPPVPPFERATHAHVEG